MRQAAPRRTQEARHLRREATTAERLLWGALRGRRLANFKFTRQEPIGPYFADFACRTHHLVIEIDAATHSTDLEKSRDEKREAALRQLGYRVLRFQNDDVYNNLEGVLESILAALQPPLAILPLPATAALRDCSPTPQRGEGRGEGPSLINESE